MGNTRDWTDAPIWGKRTAAAERGAPDPEQFFPPSVSHAVSCSVAAAARSLAVAAAEAGVSPEELLVLSSLKMSPDPFDSLRCYRVLGLGGRALPFAAGAGSARISTRVVCVLSTARGSTLGWLQEASRAGLDAAVLVVNGGACRAASAVEPDPGLVEASLRSGAGFVARVLPNDKDAAPILSRALRHKGLAVVDMVALCPTHNADGEAESFASSVRLLSDLQHDAADFDAAIARAAGPSNIGIFFDVPEASKALLEPAPETRALSPSEHEALWSALR